MCGSSTTPTTPAGGSARRGRPSPVTPCCTGRRDGAARGRGRRDPGGGLGWRWCGPTPPGHATRREIRRVLSVQAARRTAAWTRPGMSARDRPGPRSRRSVPRCTAARSARCARPHQPDRHHRAHPDGQVPRRPGAQGFGRTRRAAVLHHQTRPAGVHRAGPNPPPAPGAGAGVRHHRHDPLARSGALVTHLRLRRHPHRLPASAHPGRGRRGTPHRGTSGNDRVFRERATMVVAAYLLAAALHGRGVGVLVRWAIGKPPDTEPADLLEPFYPQLARTCAPRSAWWPRPPTRCGCRCGGSSSRCSTPAWPACAPRGPAPASTPARHISQGGRLFLIAGAAPGRARHPDPDRAGRALADHRTADGPAVPDPPARPARHRGARRAAECHPDPAVARHHQRLRRPRCGHPLGGAVRRAARGHLHPRPSPATARQHHHHVHLGRTQGRPAPSTGSPPSPGTTKPCAGSTTPRACWCPAVPAWAPKPCPPTGPARCAPSTTAASWWSTATWPRSSPEPSMWPPSRLAANASRRRRGPLRRRRHRRRRFRRMTTQTAAHSAKPSRGGPATVGEPNFLAFA